MTIVTLLWRAAYRWYDKDANTMAAAFSYYAPFALTPLLLLSITIVGFIYGRSFVGEMFLHWGSVLGAELLTLIGNSIDTLSFQTDQYSIPVVGFLFFSGVIIFAFNTLTSGLHVLWDVPHCGVTVWLHKCARSIAFVFILQVYLVIVMGLDGLFGFSDSTAVSIFPSAIVWCTTACLFYLMYRLLSWQSPSARGALVGALVASGLFTVSKSLVVLYVGLSPAPKLFDTAGLIVVLLIWIYVVTLIIYYGATVAYEYDRIGT